MATEEYSQRITRTKEKLSVTIPPEIAEYLAVNQGDEVSFRIENKQVVIRPERSLDLSGMDDADEDFIDGMRHVLDQYDQTFRTLADRRGG
ncbi:AbrB/MazE/SpoVT family DNA-binding domain-containing protein [Salisediminibacterium halotolerans]|uniref:AbrB/MazE/SpoVT family DNA-binding domain-containing protein n=1 Tax=Salisediminibacterium halotolerans TaxID=517425 RepID=UPI000EACDCD4|nr:AbrB/MazE/SpoVT family DNA-binding domain-containing protein [Salisediminibacterium halotolerans]RLJ75636.1 antidote-toxin recognition antitoxin MazE [Actinophytocola xinjiangensis]RPE89490.1 antidote-toxin recognition antitoxin MazE [Salisediminibacterium halotolerans]TWG36249.1 antidote-toxin recognition antitoxin MazE [Salisediminibacterium halotolerans]GEL08265.1 hypothetical protein SHA02_16810 [Salisediminibacterium halotolerans]